MRRESRLIKVKIGSIEDQVARETLELMATDLLGCLYYSDLGNSGWMEEYRETVLCCKIFRNFEMGGS